MRNDVGVVTINCDLGEKCDGSDLVLMPWLDLANVACGGHAGDEKTIRRAVIEAKNHSVRLGAHPGYPDKERFGRVSLDLSLDDLTKSLIAQLEDIQRISNEEGMEVTYVKPHGALYHDLMGSHEILRAVIAAIRETTRARSLMISATHPKRWQVTEAAECLGFSLILEAFCDRAYQADGQLLGRSHPNSLLSVPDDIFNRFRDLSEKEGVWNCEGEWMTLKADTVCVHGDNPAALDALKLISAGRF